MALICKDCGNPKRSIKGVRCAGCSAKRTAKSRKMSRSRASDKFKEKKIMESMFTIKAFDPNTDKWEIFVGGTRMTGVDSRRKWKNKNELIEFFHEKHSLTRYPVAVFHGSKLIENLN